MTDATQEALRQSLQYHLAIRSHYDTKQPSAEQIVTTAKKFEDFLEGKKSKKSR